ncbi:hypothetical protein M436DRAFT_61372 [Aureobasidium namibiae CBS 147.97]|uniref:Uncharacterized protein n=1 Tax=Aureobasidium namibiae CBS 147.97 TaxID=1043004 RepID=A0A074WSI0_9PEZI
MDADGISYDWLLAMKKSTTEFTQQNTIFHSTTFTLTLPTSKSTTSTSNNPRINMAPLPVQLSTVVAFAGTPVPTPCTFHLAGHSPVNFQVSPVVTSWQADLPIHKRWLSNSMVSHGDDDDGDYITVEETPVGGDDDDDETSSKETPDGLSPTSTEEDDGDTGDKTYTNDTTMPVGSAGTEASAEVITSELVEKYGTMPTTIDDCINIEDAAVTQTDENDNNTVTINCTALTNMETWYLLPCDDHCHNDLEKIIPGVVVGSGASGGLLPTILNNRGLWSNNAVSQTAIIDWLTTHLQNVRNLLSTDVFDWSRVQSNIKDLMQHPPVDLPLENDVFPAPEGAPEPASPEAIEAAETAVEEASNALENLKHMTNDPDALRSAEEHLADQQEILRQLRESENVLPGDHFGPTYTPEEIAVETVKLEDAVQAVERALKNYKAAKGNPTFPKREQAALEKKWLDAKKTLKQVRDHIRDNNIPVDDILENTVSEEVPRWTEAEIRASKEAVKNAKEALKEARGVTDDGDVVEALEQTAKNAADAERFMEDDVFEVKPKKTVEEAQTQLDQMREISDKGQEELQALDKDLQNMMDNIPEGPPEAVEAYQKGLESIESLKKLTTEHMAKVAKDLLKAERALKRANCELKVTFPDDPVEGEQENPYKPDRVYDEERPDLNGTNDDDDADENKDGEEPADGEESTEEPIDPDNNTETNEKTEVTEPTETETTKTDESAETSEPSETEANSEGDEPTKTDETSNDNEPSDDGESIDIGILPPGEVPIVPPGAVPPMVIPIPGVGDVSAPTKILQEAAGALKEAAEWLAGLNDKNDDKKDHKAIKKAERKVKEAKKKLKKEQEKEKKKHKQEKADKKEKEEQAKEDKKKEEQAEKDKKKSKSTSTKTTSSKTPEPTVHHKQHEAEMTFRGEHKHKFELYGKDWARGKNDADKLHDNMENCGMKIKDWEFSYADDKPEIKTSDWTFYAKGELLRKTAADVRCLNKVIQEANGPKDLISDTDGVDEAEVATQFTFSDKHFTVYGKGFAGDKDSGEQLKEKMAKCSKVKDWKFYTQKKDHGMKLKEQGWDFYAEGEVKDVKRKCLNEVIQDLGGPIEAIAEGDI